MEYNFHAVEAKWQQYWRSNQTYKADIDKSKPKYYVLDMFPYPSGAGLHVGHPLGYIASDIFSRYKRLKGFNVLHPMGYDAFGLPAEQYAIQTGQHPAITTAQNINRYREQLDKIGFSFDWSREVRTSDPEYYKWTQWIFIKLFHSWYNPDTDKAESIDTLIPKLEGFSSLSEKEKSDLLMNYRLAYLSETHVNWCPALGTVLANEEVKDGVSERGGYPVERKLMPQWSLRITAYAERLLNDLEQLGWSDSIKEAQRNWIGRSEGAMLTFKLKDHKDEIEVFTTRPDTIFGVSFLTLAPEHELVEQITTPEFKKAIAEYIHYAKSRSERDRMSEVKKITGQFTGAYVIHPFTNEKIPVWIGDYVLAGYGTGAVMAVPAGDQRDWDFATHFNLPIPAIVKDADISEKADPTKDGIMINSGFLNGLTGHEAIKKAIVEIENRGLGKGKINYRLRDAIFGRQRYWGEPIPVFYKDGIPQTLAENELPLVLPEVDKYLPTEDGEPPLARAAASWKKDGKYDYETTTMPGWAGSSWYYLRYMDSKNENAFASKEAVEYWKDVDLYIGGSEHATGHLLYVRFWTKFLHDLKQIPINEPAKKLINQGMIQGVSALVYCASGFAVSGLGVNISQIEHPKMLFISKNIFDEKPDFVNRILLKNTYRTLNPNVDFSEIDVSISNVSTQHVPIGILSRENEIDISQFISLRKKYDGFDPDIIFEENGTFVVAREVEKMSKSKWNVVSPDDIIETYGADTLRMYEMFLGPLEQSKPWNTNGISGVANFIRKLWRLYHNKENQFAVSEDSPSAAELKVLHKTIRKAEEDIERFSFNTSVSTFMICVNELTDLKCNKRSIVEPLAIILSPYAPHIAEELWSLLGHKESITTAEFPKWEEKYLVEDSYEYPVSINGKTRFKINLALTLSKEEVEKNVLNAEEMSKYLNGNSPKKIIVVPGRIVNVVV